MISWIGHNNDHHCYISNHCAIEDDDEVVLTGGVGSAKMATVTKYNVKGEATSLLSLLSRMWKIYLCGPRDGESGIMMISVVVNNYLQIYIVTGGTSRCEGMLARTKILKDLEDSRLPANSKNFAEWSFTSQWTLPCCRWEIQLAPLEL